MPLSRKIIHDRRKFLVRLVLSGFSIGLLIVLYNWLFYDRNWITTDNAFVTGNLINVTADATGVVDSVLYEETQVVHKGDIIVKLDSQRALAEFDAARANLGKSVRTVGALFANRRQICQKISSRKAQRERTQHDIMRYKKAVPGGAASPQLLQNSEDQLSAQDADIKESIAELSAVEARIAGTTRRNHPEIEASRAKFVDEYIELKRQNIRAPATGYLAKRRVQVGQRVKPGDLVITIIPLDHLWVEANIWENRLDSIRPGQEVIIKPDVFSGKTIYHGRVEGIVPGSGSVFATLPPDNATGNFIRIVQRIPVRIALDRNELIASPLRPGLSTVASINVSNKEMPQIDSILKISTDDYVTNIYRSDNSEAKKLAEDIIKENIFNDKNGIDEDCVL